MDEYYCRLGETTMPKALRFVPHTVLQTDLYESYSTILNQIEAYWK